MHFIKSFIIVSYIFGASCMNEWKKVRTFEGYKVIGITCKDDYDVEVLKAIENMTEEDFDFWTPIIIGTVVQVMTGESHQKLEDMLTNYQIEYSIFMDDIQKEVDREKAISKRKTRNQEPGYMDWNVYHQFSQIYEWLEVLDRNFSHVSVTSIGTSYEGRDLRVVKISSSAHKTAPNGKKAVFIEGGIHAREWISPAVVTYLINEFATKFKDHKDILDIYDLHFMPIANPDGYAYTQIDRMWRKTRQPHGECIGADPNRNFDIEFGGPGTSNDSCSNNYHGPFPFSEPEMKAQADYIAEQQERYDEWQLYLSFHSAIEMILTPNGYTDSIPETKPELKRIANLTAEAIEQRYGTKMKFGSISKLLGIVTSNSLDYYFNPPANFKYAYCIELRDRKHSFLLPEEFILPTCLEAMDGFLVMLKEMI